ncbi:MAG: Smr/MutS family protein, partial [Chloroflexi bacterium]|nr:Smr/MutS family protein [Chloroflexota bacterium]
LFVEPWTTVEMGNTMRELKAEEKREVERILRKLSSEVGAYEKEISQNIARAAEIDLALAKAKFAGKFRAVEPTLTSFDETSRPTGEGQQGIIRLLEARHPMLAEKAVPVSIEIGRDFSILVITGPNTGGKTVALKTIGLFSLMTQAGIPIPASPESCLPVFDGIYADIGDEQSIEQTLSSFSWHMGNIVRIVNGATRRSLVLLDELGTSTDPTEGSALAHSILLHFLRQGTITIATTHYSSLKVFAHTTPGLQNASFEFDPVTFIPTYRLSVGIPGGSNALVTASRLGLLPDVVNEARSMLSESALELETLLNDLMAEKQKTEAARQSLEQMTADMEIQQREIASRQRKLKNLEENIIVQFRDKVVLETTNLHREIKRATAELRKEKSSERIEQARKTLARVQEQLQSEVWSSRIEKTDRKEADKTAIMVGDTVRLSEADIPATVLSVSEKKQQVEVQVGRARLNIGLHRVEKISSVPDHEVGKINQATLPPARHVSLELDLRGKRADDVEVMLDSYLNDATLAGHNEVRIIHGIGTGAIRRMVRDILASHPLVKSFRTGGRGEGGDGASVVSL